MPDKSLSDPKPTTSFGKRQEDPRKETIGGSVSVDEKNEILAALMRAGYRHQSEGIREVMLRWARANPIPAKQPA